MPDVVELVVSWLVTNALTFLIVFLDERKVLSEEQLERAWPPSSRDAAIVAFGPLVLPIHFMRTRASLTPRGMLLGLPFGLLLGAIALVVVMVVGGLVLDGVFWALGFPDPG